MQILSSSYMSNVLTENGNVSVSLITTLVASFHLPPAHLMRLKIWLRLRIRLRLRFLVTHDGWTPAAPSLLKLHQAPRQLTDKSWSKAAGKAWRTGPHLVVDDFAKIKKYISKVSENTCICIATVTYVRIGPCRNCKGSRRRNI